MSVLGAVALVLALGAVPASAATLCVRPSGGACSTTIQAAVDAAAGGDRIQIGPGIYYENVVIPSGKDGLTLLGGPMAILDPSSSSAIPVVHTGAGISIASNRVTIQGFTIRNGDDAAIRISADDAIIRAMRFVGSTYGIRIFGRTGTQILANQFRGIEASAVMATVAGNARTVVRGNTAYACDSCFDLNGDDIVVSGNHLEQCSARCISVFGFAPTVQLNVVRRSDGAGITVSGDSARVANNTVAVTSNTALDVTGDNAAVTGNSVTDVHEVGISVMGRAAAVSRNRVSTVLFGGIEVGGNGAVVSYNSAVDADITVEGDDLRVERNTTKGGEFGGALDVSCTACTRASVAYNTVTDTYGNGMFLTAGAPGMVVEANTVSRSRLYSYYVNGTGVVLKNNRAQDQGYARSGSQGCFYVVGGGGNTLTGNVAARCATNGFELLGDNNTLSGNVATDNIVNGFLVWDGVGNTLTANRASGNLGAGFAVAATGSNTSLTSNVSAAGDRTSFCDGGSGTLLTGNTFPTIAPTCDILH